MLLTHSLKAGDLDESILGDAATASFVFRLRVASFL